MVLNACCLEIRGDERNEADNDTLKSFSSKLRITQREVLVMLEHVQSRSFEYNLKIQLSSVFFILP